MPHLSTYLYLTSYTFYELNSIVLSWRALTLESAKDLTFYQHSWFNSVLLNPNQGHFNNSHFRMQRTSIKHQLTFGASKQAGQFSVITGSLALSANCLRCVSLTYTNGLMTLKSPSLGKQCSHQQSQHTSYSLDCVVGLHCSQEAIVESGHEEALC